MVQYRDFAELFRHVAVLQNPQLQNQQSFQAANDYCNLFIAHNTENVDEFLNHFQALSADPQNLQLQFWLLGAV